MKIKKVLKDRDKESRKNYENSEFLEKMKSNSVENHNQKKVFSILFAASLILIIVAITLICVYCIPKEIYFYADNEIISYSTIDELNETSDIFKIIALDGYRISCEKSIDKQSKVLLSYIVTVIDDAEISNLQIRVIVNQKFIYSEDISDLSSNEVYDDFSMKYVESFVDDEGLISFNSKGFIQKDYEKIYIKYSGFSFEQNSGLIDLIAKLIECK